MNTMAKNGVVKFFNAERGFGFITPDNPSEPDVFVHITAVQSSGLTELAVGDRVSFETKPSRDPNKGPLAVNLELIQ